MKTIFVVASINVDMVANVKRIPSPGETLFAVSYASYYGGKGANQALAASKLGADVCVLGKVGKDALGSEYREMLDNETLKALDLKESTDLPTGRAFINVSHVGENAITVVSGANAEICADDIRTCKLIDHSTSVVLSQLEVPESATIEAYSRAKAFNAACRCVFNPAPILPISESLWQLIDILILNESELYGLSQSASDTVETTIGVCSEIILDKQLQAIIVTRGEKDTILVSDKVSRTIPSHPVDVKDTTAAGDSFIGAFAARLVTKDQINDESLLDCVRFANRVASITVQSHGAQNSLPTKEQVAALGYVSP